MRTFKQQPKAGSAWSGDRAELGRAHFEPSHTIADVVHSPGVPLDPAVRASAEARLGFDFSRVRVHTDEAAARSADAVRARAYTVGSHIAFARGEYQPRTRLGARMVLHELVHVAQQGPAADATPTPQKVTQPHDASEREAHALASLSGAVCQPPRIVSRLGPVVARFDPQGAELQKERSEALAHGLNPDEPVSKPPDALKEALREATRNPQPKAPEPTMPGDPVQQADTLPEADSVDLWHLPRIHDQMKALAEKVEAREMAAIKPGGHVTHTAAAMMDYWRKRFVDSVDYILYIRMGGKRAPLLKQLRAQEDKLIKSNPADLVAQVEALRFKFKGEWQQQVDLAADRFVILASNEADLLSIKQVAAPVKVYGLPQWIEGAVEASKHPGEVEKGAAPVAPSVVTFIKAVQKESGLKVVAENYADHEKFNPYIGDVKNVGKYSFDVHLDGFIGVNAEGFYEREPLIKFFLAVERAAKATGIEWVAFYNDFEVEKTVNEKVGKWRVGFSGGGGVPGKEGSFHHGPAPYILHIHFNIMPIALATPFILGKAIAPYIDLSRWK